jgi:hypothetical protein
MLEFFRKYQKFFFFFIAIVITASFAFVGTYDAIGGETREKDWVVSKAIDGSSITYLNVKKLSRFLSVDYLDAGSGRAVYPNFCNDGVIRNDFLKGNLGALLVGHYFDDLKEDFVSRLDRVKRYRPYTHPEFPFLSARTMWDLLAPGLSEEVSLLQGKEGVSRELFSSLAKIYCLQEKVQPEYLRKVLINQQRQCTWLKMDPRLMQDDLAVFGMHSASDWFGNRFIDLVSQFILNGARFASQKGYQVSFDEAKGDLIHNFEKFTAQVAAQDLTFQQHLRNLGFEEREAILLWQKVLLFRKAFHDVGETAFIDRLAFKGFEGFAGEVAKIEKYDWPIVLTSAADLAQFELYVKTIAPKGKGPLPTTLYSPLEVEKKMPELVQTTYKADVAEVSKGEVALRATIKEIWQWETNDKNWRDLQKKFSLPNAESQEARFKALAALDSKVRGEVDAFARSALVDENPEWIQEALALLPKREKIWSVTGDGSATLKEEGKYFLVENLEKIKEKHILLFSEAKSVLSKHLEKVDGECKKDKNPFFKAAQEAHAALKRNPLDSSWIASGDPLLDQFKMVKETREITRTAKESWMKDEAFLMLPQLWSPIHVSDSGSVTFFYLTERHLGTAPILDRLTLGKQSLAQDAQGYFAERLLDEVKHKNAIVIPLEREGE